MNLRKTGTELHHYWGWLKTTGIILTTLGALFTCVIEGQKIIGSYNRSVIMQHNRNGRADLYYQKLDTVCVKLDKFMLEYEKHENIQTKKIDSLFVIRNNDVKCFRKEVDSFRQYLPLQFNKFLEKIDKRLSYKIDTAKKNEDLSLRLKDY